MLDWYGLCERKEWDKAIEMQWKMALWAVKVDYVLAAAGYPHDPVGDKAMAEAAGFLKGGRYTRKPYLPLPDEQMEFMINKTLDVWPELLAYRAKE